MSQPPPQTLDFDALVTLITESVLGRLQATQAAPGVSPTSGSVPEVTPVGRRLTWVLAAACGHLPVVCEHLAVLSRLGHTQRVLACPDVADGLRSASAWPGESAGLSLHVVGGSGPGLSTLLSELSDQELVYVGSLGWHQAAALEALDDREGLVRVVLGALAANTPVCLLADETLSGLHGLAPGSGLAAAPTLKRQAEQRWRALQGLGVQPLALAELRQPLAALEAAASPQGRAYGGLLTERDVEEAAAAGVRELRLDAATRVTPLARDRARDLDVRIEQT